MSNKVEAAADSKPPVKKGGWINVYDVSNTPDVFPTGRSAVEIYPTKEAALQEMEALETGGYKLLDTVQISWEERE